MLAIHTIGLTKMYGNFCAVDSLDLEIEQGEVFGFIGPNGAGKSTTIRTLLGLLSPTSGRASILGLDIEKNGTQIRREVGYLPSEIHFYDRLTAGEVLQYALKLYGKGSQALIDQYVELFQVDTKKKMKSLSLGNKKKVAIIQALLHNPQILILDEPTSGLDPLMQERLFHVLQEEKKRGKTIFFSTHVLGEIEKICDRFAIIRQGQIVEIKDVQSMRASLIRLIRVRYTDPQTLPTVQHSNIVKVEQQDGWVQYYVKGKLNQVLKEIVNFDIEDIKIDEPSIEDIFMEYYK